MKAEAYAPVRPQELRNYGIDDMLPGKRRQTAKRQSSSNSRK